MARAAKNLTSVAVPPQDLDWRHDVRSVPVAVIGRPRCSRSSPFPRSATIICGWSTTLTAARRSRSIRATPAPVLAEAERRGWTINQIVEHPLAPRSHRRQPGGERATGAQGLRPGRRSSANSGRRRPAQGRRHRPHRQSRRPRCGKCPAIPRATSPSCSSDAGVAFVGDTLFAMGCGRLFEGTPEQMFSSLQRIAALPDDTRLYCAHEYTLANARFAAHADPANAGDRATGSKRSGKRARRGRSPSRRPSREELATNVFVRASDAREFAELRHSKDAFR